MRKILIILLSLFFLHYSSLILPAQPRGFTVKIQNAQGQTSEVSLYTASYALVIGESDYTGGWDDLPGVKADVAEIRRVLNNGGFVVEAETDLASDALNTRIVRFIKDYGYGQNNRLLIYFAGHGHTQKAFDGRDLGYVVPTDAPLPGKDPLGFRRKAISEDTVRNYARMIEAKHAIFIFDSCFSGKLVSRGEIKVPPVIMENVAYPVRQFITAGAADQTVPDNSIFRKAFVRALEGEADRNGDKFITGTELAEYLKEKVTNATDRGQTPQYGKIHDIDLDRGDFVFTISKDPVVTAISEEDRKAADNLTQKALAKFKAAELEESVELATKALSLDSNQALALAIRGHARTWLSNKKEYGQSAEEDLREAVKLEPANGIYRALLSDFTRNEIEKTEILKLLAKPKDSLEFFALGIDHLWLDGDVSAFDKAISLEPKFTMAYFERGMLFADGPKNATRAFADMTTVIEGFPKDNVIKGIAFYIRASIGVFLKNSSASIINDFSKAIQTLGPQNENPYLIRAYEERAETYLKLGKYDEAINDYTKLLILNKNVDAFTYHKRAKVYFDKGDYQNTISDCTQAINISLDKKNRQAPYSGFYELRADAYEKIGLNDLAAADRQKGSQLKADFFSKIHSPAAETPASNHGKKANKILFIFYATAGNKISTSEIFSINSELDGLVNSKLKEKGLTVLRNGELNSGDYSQYMGGTNSRNDEKALRLLPLALVIELYINLLEDMPKYGELFVSKVSGYIEIIDTDNNKTLGIERFDQIRGFGNTQDQARRNALRSAGEGISDSFLNLIKEKAK